MVTKQEILRQLSIGSRVAEEEGEQLSRYFVETDQWRRILAGEVDIVFGPKGAGKSAIYTSLVSRIDDLFDRRVVIVPGEHPRGTPAFNDIVAEPPTSEAEFVGLWKFYILALLNEVLIDYEIGGSAARRVRDELAAAGLGPAPGGLRGLVQRAREYVSRLLNPESFEGGLKLDTAGNPTGITAKITLREPSAAERAGGLVSVDELITLCAEVLSGEDFTVWLVFDRLDVAFADSRELEANASEHSSKCTSICSIEMPLG